MENAEKINLKDAGKFYFGKRSKVWDLDSEYIYRIVYIFTRWKIMYWVFLENSAIAKTAVRKAFILWAKSVDLQTLWFLTVEYILFSFINKIIF